MISFRSRSSRSLLLCALVLAVSSAAPAQFGRGVALAGPEFSEETLPGQEGVDFTFNSERSFSFFSSEKLNLIRIPLRWERLQPTLFGALDETYLAGLQRNIQWASAHDCRVVLDIHNYGRYTLTANSRTESAVLDNPYNGSVLVPSSALVNLWTRLSALFAQQDTVLAYGLMNEPHDMGPADWKAISQAVLSAIRATGDDKLVMVAGDSWSSAERWETTHGPTAWIDDPADNVAYEAHLYFDQDASGRYLQTFANELAANPNLLDIGATRLAPFRQWCSRNGVRCYVGEFGVPGGDPGWLEALDRFLTALDEAKMDATYWAAGEFWGDYPLSIQPGPNFDQDPPQLAILRKHLGVDHVTVVSAASFVESAASPGSLVSGFGAELATGSKGAESLPLPTELGGVQVILTDILQRSSAAQLVFVSPTQINFLLPEDLALGKAGVEVVRNGETAARGEITVSRLAPALFSSAGDGRGAPAALLTTVGADGRQQVSLLGTYNSQAGAFVPAPIRFGPGDRLFVSFFGTGFRAGSGVQSAVRVGETSHELLFLGPQSEFPGLDQANIELSPELAGAGQQAVTLVVENRTSNVLVLLFDQGSQ
ncbi:MAG: cellulase family glycosylhydrolase [Acidobacteria bacterium]|nr:cellulase family glycosylhydrolase [Acidobacteriota bacterium]